MSRVVRFAFSMTLISRVSKGTRVFCSQNKWRDRQQATSTTSSVVQGLTANKWTEMTPGTFIKMKGKLWWVDWICMRGRMIMMLSSETTERCIYLCPWTLVHFCPQHRWRLIFWGPSGRGGTNGDVQRSVCPPSAAKHGTEILVPWQMTTSKIVRHKSEPLFAGLSWCDLVHSQVTNSSRLGSTIGISTSHRLVSTGFTATGPCLSPSSNKLSNLCSRAIGAVLNVCRVLRKFRYHIVYQLLSVLITMARTRIKTRSFPLTEFQQQGGSTGPNDEYSRPAWSACKVIGAQSKVHLFDTTADRYTVSIHQSLD